MQNKTFHRNVFMPDTTAIKNKGHLIVRATEHALARSIGKGFRLPRSINLAGVDIVEWTPELDKILLRLKYSDRHDLCMVLIVGEGLIITAWLNAVGDTHSSLDTSRYLREEEGA